MLERIETAQRKYAALFEGNDWQEDELSNIGWLGLVGVPWLLAIVKNDGHDESNHRNKDCNPGTNCVVLPEPSLEFVLTKDSVADTFLVVPAGNPFAKFFVRFITKIVRVGFVCHVSSND